MVLCALVLTSATTSAYVRSRSPRSGAPFLWVTSCIPIRVEARDARDADVATLDATLRQAITNWASRTDGCSTLRLLALEPEEGLEVEADSKPVVVVRDETWSRPGGMPHDPSAIGLTTVFHVSTPGRYGDGTIIDADIELNGVNFTFTTDPPNAIARDGTTLADLENTLTHELGHVLGLAHTCWDRTTEEPLPNEKGEPSPDCNDPLGPEIIETTMYPFSITAGEIEKRSLSEDEVRGVCEIYPATQPAAACFQRIQGGCAVTPPAPPPPWPAWLAGLALVVALALARRRLR